MDINQIEKLLSEGKEEEAYKVYMSDQTTFHPNVTKEQFLRMWRRHFNNGVNRGLSFCSKLLNALGKKVMEYKGYSIQDYGGGNFVVWTDNGNGFASMNASSIEEAKSKIDARPHPKFQPGSRQSEGY